MARRRRPGDESEADLQVFVLDAAARNGWKWHHETDSRKTRAGFPDLVLVHAGRRLVLFRELKAAYGVTRHGQIEWLEILTEAGADAKIWTPEDKAEILEVLSEGRMRL